LWASFSTFPLVFFIYFFHGKKKKRTKKNPPKNPSFSVRENMSASGQLGEDIHGNTPTGQRHASAAQQREQQQKETRAARELHKLSHFSVGELEKAWQEHGAKSASLSYEPFAKLMGTLLKLDAQKNETLLRHFFALFDIDNSDSIEFDELATALTVLAHGNAEEKTRMLFDMFDLNGDGKVSKEEFAHVVEHLWGNSVALSLIGFAPEEARLEGVSVFVEHAFADADADGDGFITRDEYAAVAHKYTRFGKPLQMLDTQTGGHVGGFKMAEAGQLMKKVSAPELEFYTVTLPATPGLDAFTPQFFGTSVEGDDSYIVMEDLCRGYVKPCILDLKMGTTSAGEDAAGAKLEAMRAKDLESTTHVLGMRFTGMRVWNEPTDTFERYNKSWGRKVTVDSFDDALKIYFNTGNTVHFGVIPRFLVALHKLAKYLGSQHHLRFYSSSLLFIYDGANPDADVRLKMIDFAHVFPIREPEGLDDGYLLGLNDLIKRLSSLASQ
jgi:Ca2+-binding EF-hand superfamily protein